MNKISGVYKITNNITGEFYIGSSKNIKQRWVCHKSPSRLKYQPNSRLYQDMQDYGLDKFSFEILAEVEPEYLRQAEQNFISLMKPTYNDRNSKGLNTERLKEYQKKYPQSDKGKEIYKRARNKYNQTEKGKKAMKKGKKKYSQSDKGKKAQNKYNKSKKGKEAHKKYWSQLCLYDNEMLTLGALRARFRRAKVEHACIEAEKYLITG